MFLNEGGLVFGAREFLLVLDYFAQPKLPPTRHFQMLPKWNGVLW